MTAGVFDGAIHYEDSLCVFEMDDIRGGNVGRPVEVKVKDLSAGAFAQASAIVEQLAGGAKGLPVRSGVSRSSFFVEVTRGEGETAELTRVFDGHSSGTTPAVVHELFDLLRTDKPAAEPALVKQLAFRAA